MTGLLRLAFEFFKTGLFAVGGGLATLPFLYAMGTATGWFNAQDVANMIAISESTPGPMGVNMATYVGFQCGGVLGGVIATAGLVTPSVIVIIIVYKFLERFRKSTLVENAFYGLRPIVVGLIASAGFGVIVLSLFNKEAWNGAATQWGSLFQWREWILFFAILFAARKWKKVHPIVLILIGAAVGIVFQMA